MEDDDVWDDDFLDDGSSFVPTVVTGDSYGFQSYANHKKHPVSHAAESIRSGSITYSSKPHELVEFLMDDNSIARLRSAEEDEDSIPNIGLDGLELEENLVDDLVPLDWGLLTDHGAEEDERCEQSNASTLPTITAMDGEADDDMEIDSQDHHHHHHQQQQQQQHHDDEQFPFDDCNDEGFNEFDENSQMDMDGGEEEEMDDEEDDDWDRDLDIDLPPSRKPEASQRAVVLSGIRNGTAQPSESLLDFVESAVREKMAQRHKPLGLQPDDLLSIAQNDDIRQHDLQNQRLKALPEWLRNTSKALHSTIHSSNCVPLCNARISMESECSKLLSDVSLIEEIVERCEEEPTKESCIVSLEIAIKWIRGVCHSIDYQQNDHGNGSSNIISSEMLDQLFSRCDYILSEQSRATVARILELDNVLRQELSLLRLHDVHTYAGKRCTTIPDFFHVICHQFSLCRIQLYMMEIKAHVNNNEHILSQLDTLQTVYEEVATLRQWLEQLAVFLPPEEMSLSTNNAPLRFFKTFDSTRALVIEKTRIALSSRLTHSIHHHQFRLQHAEELYSLLVELQALCLSNQMLALANISPVTLHYRKPTNKGLAVPMSPKSLQRYSLPAHSRSIPTVRGQEIYNVVYEMSIGAQFLELMVTLSSPSIVRSKLAFAACVYIQALQKDQLPWQSGQYALERQRRAVEGFGALRVNESDVAFGVDEVDLQFNVMDYSIAEVERSIVDAFSQSIGTVDEIKNLQVLLFESVVDLFPTMQKLEENLQYLSYPSAILFPHLTASMDMGQVVEEKIKNMTGSTVGQFGSVGAIKAIANKFEPEVAKQLPEVKQVPSALMQYELYLFSFAILSHFVVSLRDSYPSIAVELLEFCALVAAHLDLQERQYALHKDAFLIAIHCGDCPAAILHGNMLWQRMISVSTVNFNELFFVAEQLGEQLCVNAQYEMAIQIYSTAIRRYVDVSESSNRKILFRKHFEIIVERLYVRIGKAFMDYGSPYNAIRIFRRTLADSLVRKESLRNDESKTITLSWLMQCFYDLRDLDSCRKTVDIIKELRKREVNKLFEPLHLQGMDRFLGGKRGSVESIATQDHSYLYSSRSRDSHVVASLLHNGVARKYISNSPLSALPQFAVNFHNIDLNVMMAKINSRMGQFASALQSLASVIICTEILVGGKAGSAQGVLELGQLYYLRGKIQLEACRSVHDITFPMEVGSSQLFAALQHICTQLAGTTQYGNGHLPANGDGRKFGKRLQRPFQNDAFKRSRGNSIEGDMHGLPDEKNLGQSPRQHAFTCRKSMVYNDHADLLWDAMKWFRRSWDLFHAAGDEISAAKSANCIAECHLLPSFVPHVFFGVPLDFALDLSNWNRSETNRFVQSPLFFNPQDPKFSSVQSPVKQFSDLAFSPAQPAATMMKRFASLEEVERVSSFSFDLYLEASLPIELMESFMNLAEMSLLQGNQSNALPFWWETKDLFLYFFCDGCLVPIIRRGSVAFVERLNSILNRIVRFMWKIDPILRSNHLILLEIHNIFQLEFHRCRKLNIERSRTLAVELGGLYRMIAHNASASAVPSPTVSLSNPVECGSPSKLQSPPSKAPLPSRKSSTKSSKSFFSMFCCSGSHVADSVVERRPLSVKMPKPTDSASSLSGDSSAASSKKAHAQMLKPFEEPVLLGAEWRQLLDDWRPLLQGSNRQFVCMIAHNTVAEKQIDFGWSHLMDYAGLVPLQSTSNNTLGLLRKGTSSYAHFPSQRIERTEEPIRSALGTAEHFSSKNWMLKYNRIPVFLLSHVVNERDLMPPDDPDKSDDDDDAISLPSTSITGNSRVMSMVSKYTGDDGSSSHAFDLDDPRRPLDPFADFEWMTDIYAAHHVPQLLSEPDEANASPSSHLFLPELLDNKLEDFFYSSPDLEPTAITTPDQAKALIQRADFAEWIAQSNENVLIQRIWGFLNKTYNMVKNYRKQKVGLAHVKRSVRSALSNTAVNLLRLRTFSRQFKSSLMSYELLSTMLVANGEFHPDSRLAALGNTPGSTKMLVDRFLPLKLQERLPHIVYIHYIDEVMYMYNPYSGYEHVQMLGSNCCTKFSSNFSKALMKANGFDDISPAADDHGAMLSPAVSPFPGHASESTEWDASEYAHITNDVRLSQSETTLLFELAVEDNDVRCGGGVQLRRKLLQAMTGGALRPALEFLRACSEMIEEIDSEDADEGAAMDHRKGRARAGTENQSSFVALTKGRGAGPDLLFASTPLLNESVLSSDLSLGESRKHSSQAHAAPCHDIPMTLLCAFPTNALPWECLVEDSTVVRAMSLSQMISQVLSRKAEGDGDELDSLWRVRSSNSQKMSKSNIRSKLSKHSIKGYIGPFWNEKPLFVTVSYGEARLSEAMERLLRQRRARSSLLSLTFLHQSCDDIVSSEPSLQHLRELPAQHELSEVIRNGRYPMKSQLPERSALPENTQLCPLGVTGLALNNKLTVNTFWGQLDRYLSDEASNESVDVDHADQFMRVHDSYFPIILLTYSDLNELSEAVVTAMCKLRKDAIYIFAPLCIQDKLIIELKIALDRWCRVETTIAQHKQQLLMQSQDDEDQFISLTLTSAASNRSRTTSGATQSLRFANGADSTPNTTSSSRRELSGRNISSIAEVNENLFGSNDSDVFPMLTPGTALTPDQIVRRSITAQFPTQPASPMDLKRSSSLPDSRMSSTSPQQSSSHASLRVHHALRAKDRTWAYHVIMDVTKKMQREHAVSISVII